MYRPKLSICIPTYNRAIYLTELLDSIIMQAPTDGTLEICIADNASTDSTEEVIDDYRKKFSYITYYKQAENLGADRNYLKVVEIAHGEYCWLMGSDDKLLNNAVNFMLQELDDNHADIILCDRLLWYYGKYTTHREKYLAIENDDNVFVNLHKDTDFVSYCDSAINMSAFFSYLSGIVFRKEIWNQEDAQDFIGTAYSHVAVLFHAIEREDINLQYINEKPLVLCRTLNDSFLEEGDTLKRIALDIIGYTKLSNIFTSPLKKNACLMAVARFQKNGIKPHRLLIYVMKSTESTLSSLIACCKENKQFSDFYDRLIKTKKIAQTMPAKLIILPVGSGARKVYARYIRKWKIMLKEFLKLNYPTNI